MQHTWYSLHCNLSSASLKMNSPTIDFSSSILIFNPLPLILRHVRFFLFLSSLFLSSSTLISATGYCTELCKFLQRPTVPFCSLILRELVRLLIAPVFLLPFNVTVVRALGGAVSEFVKSLDCSFAEKEI